MDWDYVQDHYTQKDCEIPRVKFEDLKRDPHRKNRLIKERGWACWKCLNTIWQGKPIPLQLDHVDGDHTNNERSNLRILCPNCHAQTETFCGKNKGNCSNPRSRTRA